MEGAGDSIVSHVAELETREMDSSGEEPELPREVDAELATQEMEFSGEEPGLLRRVEDLIQRLEGKGEPLRSLPRLCDARFGKLFPNRASLSTIRGWRSKLRLRVLEAIGNCNTLEDLFVEAICEYDISRLTASEWEVVLRGFISSTVLRCIQVCWNSGESSDTEVESSDTEWESLCLQLGRILSSSSVTHLKIFSCPLTARCFLNLASGLRGNSDSKLQLLALHSAWGDRTAVKLVADIINCAPRLETLSLSGSRYDMDEETVGIVSQALIHSSSLKKIDLDDGNLATIFVKALAGDHGNRSIKRLELNNMFGLDTLGMDRLGDCIRDLLTSNPSLKKVSLGNFQMSPEKWHQLGEVISDNALEIFTVASEEVDWKSIEALVWAASSAVKDPKVRLALKISDDRDEWMLSLNLLGRVLRGEIKSLESLFIVADDPCTSGTNQDRMGSILSMNGKSGETSVLKRLSLFVYNKDVFKGVWKDLLQCLRGNTSLTHLDLSDNPEVFKYKHLPESKLDEEVFRDLMGLLQVNLTLEKIDVRGTSWETDGKASQIQEALKQNRKRAIYMSVFREAKLTFGAAKAGRLFLCGSPRADPNWLTNTFLGELIALGQHFQADDSESADNMMSSEAYTSKDGFVSESVFAGLLDIL
ncbi:hypothetical protein AXG93_3886s1000 [Marchantia polymorpha subsp. ruderalis]|uniref:FBD domain-containing protein n=1 Tax=Marchantia polymorpha subsp. ruderalis TaxID=1480154 RepID=A0A176WPH1_MARPO|nr:hypothetical protein AXG93_3886s1000 [Marchantia polymorpha subsp. ruderalis]